MPRRYSLLLFSLALLWSYAFSSDSLKGCKIGDKCDECVLGRSEGSKCLKGDIDAFPILFCNNETQHMEPEESAYLRCNEKKGVLQIERCPPINGISGIFDEKAGCVDPTASRYNQGSVAGSGRVNDRCTFNTDCLSGMYCSSGLCTCLSTYVASDGYCYIKINPTETGCVIDSQCSAVWPDAFCDKGSNQCFCPAETHVAMDTRDGWVCLNLIEQATGNVASVPFICPLPEGAGFQTTLMDPAHPALTDPATGATYLGPVLCTTTSVITDDSNNGDGSTACIYTNGGTNDVYVADLYDCVGFAFAFQGIPQYTGSPNGACCMNRALACIQPQKSGSNPTEPRWWYNSVTATCQQFLWDPTATGTNDHSPNNFRTIEHCESYCRDTCPRGSPQWNTAASFLNQAELTGCQTTAVCDANFECTTIGSEQWCCPTASSICGVDGGRSSDLTVLSTPYDAGYLTFNTGPSVTRFYYSVEQGRCLDFAYNGGLGNFNNFFSREDCELFCSQLQCSVGNPLRIGDEPQRCTTDSNCPSTHRCVTDQNVCCPRQQTVCSQPLRVGNCERSVRRYWYNAVTRDCEIFDFTGCQGNDNNFATLLDCQNFCRNSIPEPQCTQGDAYKDSSGNYFQCSNIGLGSACPANFECVYDGYLWGCCPTKTYTCSLSSDGGSTCGSGVSYKYHYNAQTQQCDTFEYNGCDGNSNNFASREACEEYCGVGGCPSGGQPYRDNSGQLVVCSTAVACPSTHECFTVTTGGSSINRCCPTRAYICGLPPQQGSNCGLSTLNRYYFNIVTSTCTEFNYYGCDGNANNFAGLAQCTNFCHSAACKAGDAAYINPNTMTPMECNASLQNQCPPNFDCVFDGLSSRHVCCGATDMGVCPSGEKAYMEPLDLTVRECLINVRGSCPIDYLCRFNVQRNRYYCCAPADNQLCPTGKALYRDPTTVAPIQCTLNSNTNVNVCPTSYACQSTISGAFQGYCCSQANICPNGGEFFVDEKTTMPRSCTMGSFVSCPTGFTCQSSSQSAADGFCCKETVNAVVDGCPPNEYVYMANGEITSCDPFNPPNAPCPTGYTCQYSTSNQRYQCCGAAAMAQPINSHGCPATQVAYLETSSKSTPRICTSATQDCPTGYFCQFSVVNTQFQCCGINGGCPSQSVAFIGVDGEAQQCKVGQSTCPSGFSCQRSKKGNMLCCTTGTPSGTSSDCLPNEALVNGLCMPQASVGQPCIDHAQCTGGSRCTGGACTCPPEQISSNGICASPCGIGKSLVNGQCVGQSQIGQACQSTAQCQGGSSCTDGICSCTRTQTILNNVCVPKNSTNPSASTCPISGHIPYVEPGTTNVRFCPPNVPGICPPNFSCQFSQTAQQNICCGALNAASNTDVCPGKALPYVVKGQPQICTGGRCVEGYTCLYSESARNYYCCSTTASGTSRDMKTGTDGCPRGNALLFPTTGTPVECNLGSNLCPPGYSCVENTVDGGYQCCTSAAMMNIRLKEEPAFNESFTSTVSTPPPTTPPQSPCPSYLVQVEYKFHDGKVMQRCERSCPSHQIPVHGICEDIKLKKYYEGEVEGNAMN